MVNLCRNSLAITRSILIHYLTPFHQTNLFDNVKSVTNNISHKYKHYSLQNHDHEDLFDLQLICFEIYSFTNMTVKPYIYED